MKALILATDEQQRLPLLTEDIPGPLMPIVDRPIIATSIELLARHGIKEILISVYNRGGAIAAYVGSGKRWGVNVRYVIQRQAWGSAGALKWAAGLLDETFLVMSGDVVLDLDLDAVLAFHQSHSGSATMVVKQTADTQGALQLADDGRVIEWPADPHHPHVAGITGAYIFEPEILDHIPAHQAFDTVADLLPTLTTANIPVFGYRHAGYWNALESVAAFQQAQHVFLYSAYAQSSDEPLVSGPAERVRFPSLSGRQVAPGIWVGANDSIHPTVKIAPPIFIGSNSWIGREVELDAGSIVGNDVVIDEEATISASTILSRTYVGQLVRVNERIVNAHTMIDSESGESIQVVDPFLLSTVGEQTSRRGQSDRFGTRVATTLLLIGLSPLLLLLWLVTLITSAGKPIIRSVHTGQRIGGTSEVPGALYTFDLIRFQTRRPDGRYLWLGRQIEGLELHRLPELFNVLRGDMALVGIKPLRPEEVNRLNAEWHQQRYESYAGFTGLWYVQTEPNSDLDTIIVADVYYTATRTWLGDVMLLLRTPGAWLRRQTRRFTTADDETIIRSTI